MGVLVELQEVGQVYGEVVALDGTSTRFMPGSFTTLVGPSGCGKSTLLDIVAGLNRAHDGKVLVERQLLTAPRKDTGIIFQEAALLPWRTVLENAAFALEVRKVPKAERLAVAADVLRRVGLAEFGGHYPHQLSGGMRQRTAIARVLSTAPDLVLADEPFGALDEQTRVVLGLELLKMVRQVGATVIFVTHSIQEAVLLSDRILVMSARPGRIILDAAVDLPQERNPSVLGMKEAARLIEEVWSLLRSEAEEALSRQGAVL
ncbi:ABC transporter ATP-binding protein [Castellaniella defragrans]|uniref:Hydroxymethylpyrimidine ABC transporter, ATPase component n=2 Tax=Castellaniella defragrans TaxID=75697 RepID=W8WVX4_CASD6|nr:ABC transporter ATP-binding protein [Castellaniella defragrans]KAB0615940.1 ABC transporter ATP-binding protein [Castellaniella defragrans]MBB6085417.1 NitT/TauT family transport system ATP-binding protein [Castellaniella defragrans]CDM23694.1 Hydroxymethylpyrimidine ABC transporter, ATPase component [Castellaniella defragrans 65Phen]